MQQGYYCPNCRAQVAYGQPYCANCNTILYWQQTQDQSQYSQGQYYGQQQEYQQQWGQQGYQQQQEQGDQSRRLKPKAKPQVHRMLEQLKEYKGIITKIGIIAGIVVAVIIIGVAFGGEITKWFIAPTVTSFDIKPASIIAGEQATVQWDIRGAASSISISPGIGNVPSSGTRTVSPGSTTTYTLIASNLGGSARSNATLTVSGPPPSIDSFSFNQSTITAGQTATLSWGVTNATKVSISPNIGDVALTGTIDVSPQTTTTYTLTATNESGNSTKTAILNVNASSAPIINYFNANPANVAAGKPATLSWEVLGATSINISNGIGGVASKGSLSVMPTATITYTLTADNAYSTVKKSATITVDTSTVSPTTTAVTTNVPPVINEFTISPSTIVLSENATMRWSVSGARTVTINPGLGAVPSSGYSLIVPSGSTTYTLTASNSFGSNTATATITTNTIADDTPPPVIRAFTASPSTISPGGSSTLTWDIEDARVIVIDQGIGIPGSYFSQLVSPTQTTSYTLTALNTAGSENRTVTVTVNP